jgi:hypothetical protein
LLKSSAGGPRKNLAVRARTAKEIMQADALAVLALMVGFALMLVVGVWAQLDDETRAAIGGPQGRLLAGISAAAGALLLLAAS